MVKTDSFLLFTIEGRWYALLVHKVIRVLPAAELTPIHDAPPFIGGLINIAGEVLPVLDLRQLLGYPYREMELEDRLIITYTKERTLVLWVDQVEDVVELPINLLSLSFSSLEESNDLLTTYSLKGDQIVFMHQLDEFLQKTTLPSLKEEKGGAHA